jgi:hypothetical protein
MDERQLRAAVYQQGFNDAKAVRANTAPPIDRDLPEHHQTNIKLGVVFTVVPVIRGFWVRRLFRRRRPGGGSIRAKIYGNGALR